MPDIQVIADRLEIGDVLVRYGTALDTGDSALLESCFCPGAVLEFDNAPATTPGGFAERARRLRDLAATQHIITNISADLDGDRATSTSYVLAMQVWGAAEGRETLLTGGSYADALVRTPAGWRIAHRRFTSLWAVRGTDVMTPAHDKLPWAREMSFARTDLLLTARPDAPPGCLAPAARRPGTLIRQPG